MKHIKAIKMEVEICVFLFSNHDESSISIGRHKAKEEAWIFLILALLLAKYSFLVHK